MTVATRLSAKTKTVSASQRCPVKTSHLKTQRLRESRPDPPAARSEPPPAPATHTGHHTVTGKEDPSKTSERLVWKVFSVYLRDGVCSNSFIRGRRVQRAEDLYPFDPSAVDVREGYHAVPEHPR